VPEPLGNFDDEVGVIHVIFGQVTMAQINATFVVSRIRRHIVGPDHVVNAVARPPNSCNNIVSGFQLADIGPNRFNLAEAFMTDDEVVESRGSSTVLGGVDLFVSSIDTYAQ